jgi:alkylation response protein AidB-like acyl-CoA dehydrogenase
MQFTEYRVAAGARANSATARATAASTAFAGEKFLSLCISEPGAASDVANLGTTAVEQPGGRHWVVSGVKKWITFGCYADFFVVACRTGGAGADGLSLFLLCRPVCGIQY